MSRLLKLKKWLTLADTAKYLSIVFGEELGEVDVLMLALDGHLKLSIYIVNGAFARPCVPVNIDEIEWDEMPLPGRQETFKFAKNGRVWGDEEKTYQVINRITELPRGVWDLPMIGSERLDVERLYHELTSGIDLTRIVLDGIFVSSANGDLYEIQSHFSDNEYFDRELKKPWRHPENFHPAGRLPEDAVYVVRTDAIREFEALISGQTTKVEKPMTATERNTLLTIIAALCDYSAIKYQDRGAARQIAGITDEFGASVTDDTIRKVLSNIPNALATRMK